jgi:hypothetical protein
MYICGLCVYVLNAPTGRFINSQYKRYFVNDNAKVEALKSQTKRNEDETSKIVDRVLKHVFGEEATHLIYKYLEVNYSVKRNEITEKIDLFSKGLEDFLSSGARVIELKILEDLYLNSGSLHRPELERTWKKHDFVDQMKMLTQKA